jgi:tetratricopeptide (TPR) repeat protein
VPEEHYRRGVELFDKKLYGAAIEELRFFLKAPSASTTAVSARYYLLICELRLLNQNADVRLEEELKTNPQNALNDLAYFELGNYFFEQKKYRRSIKYFEKSDLSVLPHEFSHEANFKVGYAYFQSDKFNESVPYFEKAKGQAGKYNMPSTYYLGYICYVQKKYDCALKHFEKIKGEGPRIMDLYIAQIYFVQGQYPKSLEYSNKVDASKYGNELALLKGQTHFQLEDYKNALVSFEKFNAGSQDLSVEETYQFAFSYMQDRQYEKAAAWFVKISTEESAIGQLANYQMGFCFLKANKKQNACNAFANARRTDYNKEIKETAHFNYAKLAFELGYQNIAIKTTQDFLSEYPGSEYSDAASGLLAEMFLLTNQYAQAIVVLEQIKTLNPMAKTAYQKVTFKRAEELFLNKEYAQANEMFLKSHKYISDKILEAEAYFWMGEIDYKNKNYILAIGKYGRFINFTESKQSRYYNTAFYNTGYAYFMQENYIQALNYFKKFKDQENFFGKTPDRYVDNSMRLADCYFLLSQYDQAADAYGYVISKNFQGSDYALYQQGMLNGLMKKPTQKIVILQKITTQFPASIYTDDALFEVAATYLIIGNSEQAENTLNVLISKFDGSPFIPEALMSLAVIYYNRNMDDKSLSYCKTVIDRFPRTESSQEALRLMETIYVNSGRGADYLDYIKTVPNSNIRITYQDSLLFESAMTKYREGDCEKASQGFNSYIQRFGENGFFLFEAHYYAAECDHFNKKFSSAIVHYEYVASQPKNEHSEEVFQKLSRLYYQEKNYGEAWKYYEKLEKSATSKSNMVEGLVGQMRCNYALGNYRDAKKNAVDILPIESINKEYVIEANMTLGRIQLVENNLNTAYFHFSYVAKESRNALGAEAQYNLAHINFLQVQYDSCRERIFDLNDNFAPYEFWVVKGFILLADVYTIEKDFFQARATLQGILDSYKGTKTIIEECNVKMKKIDELELENNNKNKPVPIEPQGDE